MSPLKIVITILGVPLIDWVVLERLEMNFPSYTDPYRYWPLTWPRIISLVVLEAAILLSQAIPSANRPGFRRCSCPRHSSG